MGSTSYTNSPGQSQTSAVFRSFSAEVSGIFARDRDRLSQKATVMSDPTCVSFRRLGSGRSGNALSWTNTAAFEAEQSNQVPARLEA